MPKESSAQADLPPPDDAEVQCLEDGLVLLSWPISEPNLPEGLTPSEEAVTRLVFEGRSNADIATERNTTQKTVGNQLERVFRKVNVSSRIELVMLLQGARPAP